MRKSPKTELARELRRQSTDAEKDLWAILRNMRTNGFKFRRQHPIGIYFVDFVCLEKKLIIEIDGSQHNEESNRRADNARTNWLESEGYHIIRFWNNEILQNINGVADKILDAIN